MSNKIWAAITVSLCVIIIVLSLILFFSSKQADRIIKSNRQTIVNINQELIERTDKIIELNKNPKVITKETLKKIPCTEKDEIILDLESKNKGLMLIINEDTILIRDLKGKLEKTTNVMEKMGSIKNGIDVFCLAGVDQEIEIDIYAGAIYRRNVIHTRKFALNLGIGGAVKIYQERGGAAVLEIGINF